MSNESENTETEAEEAAAVESTPRAESRVAQRDFARPLRLSGARAAEFGSAIQKELSGLTDVLAETLGAGKRLRLTGITEESAAELFQGHEGPLLALRFLAAGQPGWLVWDSAAAVTAIEAVMGCPSEGAEARELTRVESNVIGGLLAGIVATLAQVTVGPASEFTVAQELDAVGSWRDTKEAPDPHRLRIALELEGIGEPSTLHLYLPGFRAGVATAADAVADLPEHLDRVEVELAVRLPGCTIPLAQLLSLEEGDVIPIDAMAGDPVIASVDGNDVAHASWGTHQGRMVIRIEQFLVKD